MSFAVSIARWSPESSMLDSFERSVLNFDSSESSLQDRDIRDRGKL